MPPHQTLGKGKKTSEKESNETSGTTAKKSRTVESEQAESEAQASALNAGEAKKLKAKPKVPKRRSNKKGTLVGSGSKASEASEAAPEVAPKAAPESTLEPAPGHQMTEPASQDKTEQ
jgi:hypothetical protein